MHKRGVKIGEIGTARSLDLGFFLKIMTHKSVLGPYRIRHSSKQNDAVRAKGRLATSRLVNIFGNGTIYRKDKKVKRK